MMYTIFVKTYSYKKRLVSRINPSLLLKIILYNTGTLQLNKVNQMKLYTKDNYGTSLIKHGSDRMFQLMLINFAIYITNDLIKL